LCLERGRLEEVVDDVAATATALPRLPMVWATLARASAELERPGPTRDAFDKLAASDFTNLGVDSTWLSGVADCAVACAYLGDRTRAGLLLDLLAPYSDQIAVIALGVSSGAASYYLGLLATTLGRFEEADTRFAAAEATHTRIGAPTWLARTRLEWARMLLSRHQPGDAERARELRDQALATARKLGLATVERRAATLLQDCP
jgi:tetratricopeptide (TPR) repeat protein